MGFFLRHNLILEAIQCIMGPNLWFEELVDTQFFISFLVGLHITNAANKSTDTDVQSFKMLKAMCLICPSISSRTKLENSTPQQPSQTLFVVDRSFIKMHGIQTLNLLIFFFFFFFFFFCFTVCNQHMIESSLYKHLPPLNGKQAPLFD